MFDQPMRWLWPIAIVGLLHVVDVSGSAVAIAQDSAHAMETTAHQKEQLQKQLDQLHEEHHVPALWAGKFHADGRAVIAASGVRRWKSDTAAKPEDVVHIGSCTKAMTAVMIAQLCSQGKLSFDTTLALIFPDVNGLANSAWAQVTITSLLQHRSGAPANADWHRLQADHPDDAVAARRAMLLELIGRDRPDDPGFEYSNTGYALLGHIVETIEHESWESRIEKAIFVPLGMKSAGFGPVGTASSAGDKLQPEVDEDHAWGHVEDSGLAGLFGGLFKKADVPNYKSVQIDNPPPLGPAGRVHLNLVDWSKFAIVFASEQGREKLGIHPDDWQRLLKPVDGDNYAGGWILMEQEWANGRVLFHNGSNTSWYCVVFAAPEKNFCVLAATNSFHPEAVEACERAAAAAGQLP